MEKTRKTTLSDVAALADVSPITVSRALRDPEKVSPDARARITLAIAQLGYVPNPAARALASGRTDVVGVIIPSVSNNVFADVMRGIYDGLQDSPLGVQLGTTRYAPSTEEQLVRVFLSQQPAGLIVAGHDQSPGARALLERADCPVVQIMEVGPQPIDLVVGLSHYQAARDGAQHLLDRGYRAPAFLGAQMDPRSQRRLAGFRDCLIAAGLGGDDPVVTTPEPSSVSLGCRLFADLIATRPQTDAVLCNNDDLALGVLFEAQRRNIRIPDRLGICGFNDHEMMSAAEPPLTSVATDRYEMGRAAILQIRDRLAGRGQPRGHAIDLGYRLVPRRSTARVTA
ncbi:LacI family DNA-binding transcriptional regulator [Paracoccus sp. SM22M-07]|uniref:LacI family DNA-binding transcriptional regulator n=1 Tax=Paracoccus sp. SM22M-07 TaxID=1520813 RepID=UPI0009202EE7|nr:LacI family DNA-binding transcriptional regulator [Paracoccus sp. SM22M-07]OJH44833.1 transcriptional regulator [Paracoccus sp. SM22M-07]